MLVVVGALSVGFLRRGQSYFHLNPDGAAIALGSHKPASTLSRFALMRDKRFVTLSAAFALGLFAQIGLFAHPIIRLSPAIGTDAAGAAVSLAAVCLSHGLLHDGAPYGDDAIYGCWLIFHLCMLPLFPYRTQLTLPFDVAEDQATAPSTVPA